MTEQFWAKLHLTTEAAFHVVERALGDECQASFPDGSVQARLSPNKQFQPYRFGMPYDFWLNSEVYAEVEAAEQTKLTLDEFVEGIIRLVIALRRRGWVVTAVDNNSISDVLEERLVAATGWNWTEGDPTPPGWAD